MQQDPAFIQRPQIETCKKTNHIFKILSSMRGLRSMQDPVRCGHRELGAPGLGRGNLSHCVSGEGKWKWIQKTTQVAWCSHYQVKVR